MLTSSLVAKAEQQEKVSAMASEIVAAYPCCPRDELISILIREFNASASKCEFLSGIDAAGFIDSAIRNYHKSLIKK